MKTEDFERLKSQLSKLEADMGALNDWERGFIQDQIDRVRKYRENTFISPKQLAVIKKIYDAVVGDEEKQEVVEDDDIPF